MSLIATYTVDGELFASTTAHTNEAARMWLESWTDDDFAFYFPDAAERSAEGRVWHLRRGAP